MNKDCEYQPLTKVSDDGRIECFLTGTEKCQIHNGGCANCPVLNAILTQLNAFEEVYLSKED